MGTQQNPWLLSCTLMRYRRQLTAHCRVAGTGVVRGSGRAELMRSRGTGKMIGQGDRDVTKAESSVLGMAWSGSALILEGVLGGHRSGPSPSNV